MLIYLKLMNSRMKLMKKRKNGLKKQLLPYIPVKNMIETEQE
ncbi:unnamed protein product [Schistosoma curassoni]|uniref:Uncharacterized protein n=1 Tax=Schistosoma curassoni TaxID=6186 RepID=A0A183JU59_9TREM|nr:unnamed protein product [Schistosoma curassoni]